MLLLGERMGSPSMLVCMARQVSCCCWGEGPPHNQAKALYASSLVGGFGLPINPFKRVMEDKRGESGARGGR